MRRYAAISTLMTMGFSLAGCASTDRMLEQVSSAELTSIPRLERSIPVLVDVEGSRDRRTVVLAVPPPEPQLTQREKDILGEPEDDRVDLFEFYVPYAGRSRMVSGHSGEVTVGYDGLNSVAAAGGYERSVSSIALRQTGVSVSHGPPAMRAATSAQRRSLAGVGGNGEVTVGYDRANRVGVRERRRYYRP